MYQRQKPPLYATASISKRCVFFPQGVYIIDPSPAKEMFVLKSNMIVSGEKNGMKGRSVLKIKDNSIQVYDSVSYRAAISEQMLLGGENIENVTIENMVFDGNYRGNRSLVDATPTETNLMNFALVKGVNVQNCTFIDAGMACLVLLECQNNEIRNNYMYSVGQGFHNGDAIQTNGCTNTRISSNVLENVGEGIFCQHRDTPSKPDDSANVSNNEINTLDIGEASKIKDFIHPSVFWMMKLTSLVTYDKAGRAIGSAIGILSNNAKVHHNKIRKHLGISVGAAKGQGDLSTSNVEIWGNEVMQNAKIAYFDNTQGKMIRNVNGAFTVSANGQTVSKVNIRNNRVHTSFNSGIELVLSDSIENGVVFSGILDSITIEDNMLNNTCNDPTIDKCAAIDFRNVGFDKATNKNKFKRITIKRNRLGYATKGNGFWFEPCMSEVRILNNTFIGEHDYKVNYVYGSCLREINQPNDFHQLDLDCLLEPNGICINCTGNPNNCTTVGAKCLICD
jgi:hypothetical protein